MRKRPSRNDEINFINKASADEEKIEHLQENKILIELSNIKWPINETIYEAPYTEGSNLRKSLNIALKEKEWNAIDKHVKAIGISKMSWLRQAIFGLIHIERKHAKKDLGKIEK